MELLIKGGLVVEPAKKLKVHKDILIKQTKIARLEKDIRISGVKTLNVEGCLVLPGFIDMHTHLRQPGRDDEETFLSGSLAAVKGGFTMLLCMPNTDPWIDNAEVVRWILQESKKHSLLEIIPVGSISKAGKGKELAELGELKEAGCLAISDDGAPILDSELMRRALEYAKMLKLLVISHCEDTYLSKGGLIDEGYVSTVLGLRGIPEIAETIMVARNIELARFLNTRIHLAHISTKRSLELIQQAKLKNIAITAETCPHYFSLTVDDLKDFDTSKKVNPPLRKKEDVSAIKKALKENLLDCLSTDHAPHNQAEKELEFDKAPFGMIGLETALSVCIEELIEPAILDWPELADKFSLSPATILGLQNKGRIAVGKDADLVIVDPEKQWTFSKEELRSKSFNSPFLGKRMKGRVEYTIFSGRIVYKAR